MPLVKLVLPCIFGILAYLIIQARIPELVFVVVYLFVVIGWISLRRFWLAHFSRRWVFGLMTSALLIAIGYLAAQRHDQQHHKAHFSRHFGKDGFLVLRVAEPVAEKANSFQVAGKVLYLFSDQPSYKNKNNPLEPEGFYADHSPAKVKGGIILYLEKDSLAVALRYGDLVVIDNNYEEVSPPQNPRQFNYKRFLAYQNMFHSSYRRSGQWHHTGINRGNPVVTWSLQLRERALQVFAEHQLSGREFAVISALLLGYREYLDEDLQREFAGAGAMHILCVSGLHVGIIYLVLKTLLSFLKRLPAGTYIQTALILVLIWLYASITGFSPSVLRASAMFSFVAVGQSLNRRTNIYNTLAASAMVLLAINPFIITRIGFQLSYLAVVSIVSIQPWLYKTLSPKNKLLDKAWSIMTVSVAAQVATGPLSLLYFHQFPNYFLLTNLIVIPLSGLIIYSSLLTLFLSTLPYLGYFAGRLLYWLLYALHSSVKYIEGLPYSTSGNVYIGLPETILLFIFLIFGCLYLIANKPFGLKVALATLLLLVGCLSLRSIKLFRQEHFVIYQVNNATAIDFFIGKEKAVLACDRVINDPGMVSFQTLEYRISRGVTKPRFVINTGLTGITSLQRPLKRIHPNKNNITNLKPINKGQLANEVTFGHYIRFGKKNILVLSGSHTPIQFDNNKHQTSYQVISKPKVDATNSHEHHLKHWSDTVIHFPVDYLIVCQNPRVTPATYLQIYTPSKVILDASNNFWNASRWDQACDSLHIPFWAVRDRGAFISGE